MDVWVAHFLGDGVNGIVRKLDQVLCALNPDELVILRVSILFIDESMIRDYQALSRTWFVKGEQKIVPTCFCMALLL
ncbi:hypothetical protein J41TS4_46610 [Paenibacillus apis]|uniref:Uncharacterized protein n=1 Tax=Paenibacillus apis TaxID=1792174 RepID=A0A919Y826_9BACL|nr:hypothetical protein J41TS4_46610 [Paenibacillus apis]